MTSVYDILRSYNDRKDQKPFIFIIIQGILLAQSADERANYLTALGCIARYHEPFLQEEDSGLAYFMTARKLVPSHIPACLEILSMYREHPDGHTDLALAKECYQILQANKHVFSVEEQEYFNSTMLALQYHSVDLSSLM